MTATLDFLLYLTLPCHQSSPPVPRFIVNRRRTSLHHLPVFLASCRISVVADFIARVVFDAAPTLEEAKDATADLKEALDRVYLSSPESAAYQNGGTFKDGPAFGLPLHANTDNLEIKSCISCDSKLTSVPAPAFNAFKLLSESPKVQLL
ncbi:hypothetical protein ACOSP7_005018 [Xanthoceras sorbifolium]